MRIGFLAAIAVVVLAAIALLMVVSQGSKSTPPTLPAILTEKVHTPPLQSEPPPSTASAALLEPPTNGRPQAKPDDVGEVEVEVRVAELRPLGVKTDQSSLERLIAELKNPNLEIRQAVLDILSESGNRAAIPYLVEAAFQTEDAEQKEAIEETIEFLKLPTLTEVLKQAATNK